MARLAKLEIEIEYGPALRLFEQIVLACDLEYASTLQVRERLQLINALARRAIEKHAKARMVTDDETALPIPEEVARPNDAAAA